MFLVIYFFFIWDQLRERVKLRIYDNIITLILEINNISHSESLLYMG